MANATMNFVKNDNLSAAAGPDWLSLGAAGEVRRLHQSMGAFAATELVPLPNLAKKLGVKGFFVKDESTRFGLKAFKALGASWAITRVVCQRLGIDYRAIGFEDLKQEKYRAKISEMVFATATDGNHGKGVAWTAHELGAKAYVFMPRGTVEARRAAIIAAGAAECTITDMTYDDTVRSVAAQAAAKGWTVVQDTSWENYEEVPRYIAQGYLTLAQEALEAMAGASGEALNGAAQGAVFPTHVFLQAGVGAMAGALTGYLVNYADAHGLKRPLIAIVEPTEAACFYESALAADGERHAATGSAETIMAGLNCGEVAPMVWPVIRDFAAFCLAMPDYAAAEAMRLLAKPLGTDRAIVAGESGASGVGAANLILSRPELSAIRAAMKFDADSIVLCINTEGDTDPENYQKIVAGGAYPLP